MCSVDTNIKDKKPVDQHENDITDVHGDSQDEDRVKVLEVTYQHLRETAKVDDAAYQLYVQKIRHLMAAQLVLLAGIGFGLGKIEWAMEPGRGAVLFFIFVVGIAAAAVFFTGFVTGVCCLHIRAHPVVGVKNVIKHVENRTIRDISLEEAYTGFVQNLAIAVKENREVEEKRRGLTRLVNWTTAIGAVLVALFVGTVVVGDVLYGNSVEEPLAMSSSSPRDPEDSSQPENPLVEPSDEVQSGERRESPLVEPSDFIDKSAGNASDDDS